MAKTDLSNTPYTSTQKEKLGANLPIQNVALTYGSSESKKRPVSQLQQEDRYLTKDEQFNITQYGHQYHPNERPNVASDTQTEARKPTATQSRVAQKFRKRRGEVRTAQGSGSLKGSAKKARAARAVAATRLVLFGCSTLYIAQLIFAVISLAGFGLEMGILSVGEIVGGNILTRTVAEVGAYVLPGLEIFAFGWLMCIVLGMMQLLAAVAIYVAGGVNPFRGSSLQNFITVSVLYFVPVVQLFPVGAGWAFGVIANAGRK